MSGPGCALALFCLISFLILRHGGRRSPPQAAAPTAHTRPDAFTWLPGRLSIRGEVRAPGLQGFGHTSLCECFAGASPTIPGNDEQTAIVVHAVLTAKHRQPSVLHVGHRGTARSRMVPRTQRHRCLGDKRLGVRGGRRRREGVVPGHSRRAKARPHRGGDLLQARAKGTAKCLPRGPVRRPKEHHQDRRRIGSGPYQQLPLRIFRHLRRSR